ncbi:type IV pilin protein [Lyngbya confervoides]|uniref:Prepilin-type N-terminal cleavage/methylation domain-containing protein n=1 Tax=Lyngbya confervoides BDU141951 TaxID=1574623 RepID=A0ABD4TA20_9CYAN|nr:type IV pilin-like G/H family protein [Lyngbya confervoides]MCM1985245.1 prepilin-type N-terminal cleavage/methylation domain-containing protein [Lyngbya confervoides BDU141951]
MEIQKLDSRLRTFTHSGEAVFKQESRTLQCGLSTGHQQSAFTLIELIFAIVILGLLSAIALPSYLNQAAKAKGSEAKSTIGSINRIQQAYRYENKQFSSSLNSLGSYGLRVYPKNFSYTLSGLANSATVNADPIQTDLKVYSGGVVLGLNDQYLNGICESIKFEGSPTENAAQISLIGGSSPSVSCTDGKLVE